MWKPPTLDELSKQTRAAFAAEGFKAGARIWPLPNFVFAKVFAMLMHGNYQRLDYIQRQAFVTTAEAGYLDRHGAQSGIARLAANYAAGQCEVTVSPLTDIADGTRLLRSDGVVFVVAGDHSPTASPTAVNVRAAETGATPNTLAAAVLSLETPITGVGDFTVTGDGLVGGRDGETDESFRERILDYRRNPPQGGSPAEYRRWALEVPGITRAYVRRATPEAGEVTVLVMADDSVYANGIPSAALLAQVTAYLEDKAPGRSGLAVIAPTPVSVAVTITALSPNSARVRENVAAEVKQMFRRRAQPGTAAEDFIFSKTWIGEAISMAQGEGSHAFSAPAADVACGENEIAVPGSITFP